MGLSKIKNRENLVDNLYVFVKNSVKTNSF